jgi:hypothetical protein
MSNLLQNTNKNNPQSASAGSMSSSNTSATSILSSTSTPCGGAGSPTDANGNAATLGVVAVSKTKSSSSRRGELPRLFYYMETGQWDAAMERLRRNPKEAKVWATLRTKSMTEDKQGSKVTGTKRLALHHACFKLRSAGAAAAAAGAAASGSYNIHHSPTTLLSAEQDPFAQVCRFILTLVKLYPEAAGQRESRHGCLPLHLAAFASCAPRPVSVSESSSVALLQEGGYNRSQSSPAALKPTTSPKAASTSVAGFLARPMMLSNTGRTASDATNGTTDTMNTAHTNMSAVHAEEDYTGGMTSNNHGLSGSPKNDPHVSVAMRTTPATPFPNHMTTAQQLAISAKREEMAVHVLNALLDAYPKAVRVDSEGGRLPLHTACAGRATPRVISTLVTAYPSAARHRNKDGFLPLHLAAHWGVSHPDVAVQLLKTYPDATVGRNRWERTPLEEALCMAGENGRPHQALLVRALRKHPSYWSRPPSELFRLRNRNAQSKHTIVDVDESLPSSDSTTLEEQMRHFDLEALMEGYVYFLCICR